MNKHIELVKRWLSDPKSVTVEELEANADAAADYAAWTAVYAADYVAEAAAAAKGAAADGALYWVKEYEELMGEK